MVEQDRDLTKEKIRDNLTQTIKNKYVQRGKKVIVVLGSFDTWSYMDFVCRELAKMGHYVVTSVRRYCLQNGEIKRWDRDTDFMEVRMRESLRYMIFKEAHEAVIIYSVPGAQYLETEWCSERIKDEHDFKCYGITYVRKYNDSENCSYLQHFQELACTKCTAQPDHTAWQCIDTKTFCPFKKQEIAKNVIEYFFDSGMELFALERMDTTAQLLNALC